MKKKLTPRAELERRIATLEGENLALRQTIQTLAFARPPVWQPTPAAPGIVPAIPPAAPAVIPNEWWVPGGYDPFRFTTTCAATIANPALTQQVTTTGCADLGALLWQNPNITITQ